MHAHRERETHTHTHTHTHMHTRTHTHIQTHTHTHTHTLFSRRESSAAAVQHPNGTEQWGTLAALRLQVYTKTLCLGPLLGPGRALTSLNATPLLPRDNTTITCIFSRVHTHTYTRVHTHTYTFVHTHTYTFVHTHTYTCVHTYTCTCVHRHGNTMGGRLAGG